MKKAINVLVAIALTVAVQAQDRENRNHDDFSGIKVGGGVDLIITQSDRYEVEIITDGDLEDIMTEVSRGVLEIRQKSSNWFSWNDIVEVRVSLPNLEYISAGGGSDVENKGVLKGRELEIDAGGGSDVELILKYRNVIVDCSGGSDVYLEGEGDFLELETSGGSDFDGADYVVREAEIEASGGSDATVNVEERIYARASGASDITYKGSPKYVDVNSSGGADVTRGR